MALAHLLAVHSTAPPEIVIVLIAFGLVVTLLRYRSRGGGGRGPSGGRGGPFGGGPFGGRGGPFGGGPFGGGGGGGGSSRESNPPSDL